MCVNCRSDGIGRRDLMKFGAAAAIALAAGGSPLAARTAEGALTSLSPQESLAQLKAGNERFVSHPELCTVDLAQSRSAVAAHQAPWATIVACADSRVPPELVFGGHGVGELFVARHAGNLVGVDTLGTIEYGAAVLGSPLVVILAHTARGAVKATCDV
jgi:carbonic anhydrase